MKTLFAILMVISMVAGASADIVISQYVDTDSGTTPKGIELWNSGTTTIDFSADGLDIEKGVNGGAPSSDFTLSTGSLAAGDVMVIGTSDIGTYLDNKFGIGVVRYHSEGFTFNGNDSLVVKVGNAIHDVFGNPGSDPVTAWVGNGVSTQDQNIQLKEGADLITAGDIDGWTDPSIRFTTVSTSPTASGGLDGFGVAPIPEPTTFALFGLLGVAALIRRNLSKN